MITSQEIIDYLDKVFDGDSIYMSNFRAWDFEMLMRYGEFDKEDIVLDTGALHSYFSVFLAPFVRQVVTTDDLSWAERDYYAKAKLPPPSDWMSAVNEKSNGAVIAEKADVMNLPYDSEAFQKVLSISTIEHVFDDIKGMQEMRRVLKPGGGLLVTTEYNEKVAMPFDPAGFIRIYNEASIENLCHGFSVEVKDFRRTGQSYAGIPFGTLFLKLKKQNE